MRWSTFAVGLLVLLAGCTGPGTGDSGTGPAPREARAAVIEAVDPGTCFGMPSPPSTEMMNRTVQENPDLAAFIQDQYQINGSAYRRVAKTYRYIRRFRQVTLRNTSTGYRFSVEDGDCCAITTINGTVTGRRDPQVRFGQNTTKSVPC